MSSMIRRAGIALVLGSWFSMPVPAQTSTADETIEEMVVYGRAEQTIGSAQSASEGLVGYDDFQRPALLRVGELVESVPGMVATQHSGSGKANQYFLRGFNLDHGTDFSTRVDGTPINMPTHGHGQGYLDLNFLIPELVETATYRKGPYYAENGDFSSAGSVDFGLYDRLPEPMLRFTAGSYGYGRALLGGSAELGMTTLTAAVDGTVYEGPWDLDENLGQNRLYLALSLPLAGGTASASIQGYDSQWDATDQIPRRAVESGLIDEYGYLDQDLGGESSRYAVTAGIAFDSWAISGYYIDYDLTLYSNFTYLLDDPVGGDQFEQRDSRSVWGLWFDGDLFENLAGRPVAYRWGGDLRYDDIDTVGLYDTEARVQTSITRQDQVEELSLSAFAEAEVSLTERFRAVLGLRGDYYDWNVAAYRSQNSGSGDDALVSPKLALAYRITSGLEGYASWGRGLHSNDVRGATITRDPATGDPVQAVDVLVASEGAELGVRFEAGGVFNATLAAFWLELDSELVYVGDAGTVDPNSASRRKGIELTGFWQMSDWLSMHAAYTDTNARFLDAAPGSRHIPGAVGRTFLLGANAVWQNGLSGSLRVRYLGEAPLVEDDSVRSRDSWLVNAGLAYLRNPLELRLDVFNLLDTNEDDISYYYASRLSGEPPEGVEDIHFHPLEPISVRATITYRWN